MMPQRKRVTVKMMREIFDKEIQKFWTIDRIGAKVIQQKMQAMGINLTPKQIASIKSQLRKQQTVRFKLNAEQDRVVLATKVATGESVKKLTIDFDDTDSSTESLIQEFRDSLSEIIPDVVTKQSATLLKALKRNAPKMLKRRRKDRTSFESRLTEKWRKGMDLLEAFLEIALEIGSDFNQEFGAEATLQHDHVFDVLIRLHARACQIASEILTLLRSGHADGAHARWRSLHEITVVAMVISSGGNDLAERYLLHDGVESYKAALLYREQFDRLGYEPMSDEEFRAVEAKYQQLLTRFGSSYRREYGWAATALTKDNPTFRDLEEHVQLMHLRPFYKMASHNVHANPKGVFFKLGLYPAGEEVLLAGPSDTGLTDPADGTALSLGQITIILLMTRPNIDRLVICETLLTLGKEIGETFLKIQLALEK
jgi:hypothetical protein